MNLWSLGFITDINPLIFLLYLKIRGWDIGHYLKYVIFRYITYSLFIITGTFSNILYSLGVVTSSENTQCFIMCFSSLGYFHFILHKFAMLYQINDWHLARIYNRHLRSLGVSSLGYWSINSCLWYCYSEVVSFTQHSSIFQLHGGGYCWKHAWANFRRHFLL